jgi:hypothetical protein
MNLKPASLKNSVPVGPPPPVAPTTAADVMGKAWDLVRLIQRLNALELSSEVRASIAMVEQTSVANHQLAKLTAGAARVAGDVSYAEGAESMLYFYIKNNAPELRAPGQYKSLRRVLTQLQVYLGFPIEIPS